MGDFEEKLESIINNPHAMEQIMSLAQSLGGKEPASTPAPTVNPKTSPHEESPSLDPQMLGSIFSLLKEYNSDDDQRAALLAALRPFVKEQRYSKIDKAIQIVKLSRVMRTAFELFRSEEEAHV